MNITFYKYQGTGNDFVMIDNRQQLFPKEDAGLVARLCDRKFGIGADGLILLEEDAVTDFRMVYYNADGNESSMCGNGGRCLVAFAKALGIIDDKTTFIAADGLHKAIILGDNKVSLQMKDVNEIKVASTHVFLNTGSPHHIEIVDDIRALDVKKDGAAIRYGQLYGKTGSNINFVSQINENTFQVRTYERGVEDETLSCGTGVTAVAIAMKYINKTNADTVKLDTEGGRLEVAFQQSGSTFSKVFLKGPATFVFKGEISC